MATGMRLFVAYGAMVLAFAGVAWADNIFVDKGSTAQSEDGTARAPFRTITRALDHARKLRFGYPEEQIRPSRATINVHVAAGEYVGSFDPAATDPASATYDPSMERLPLLFNVPGLHAQGRLRLVEGDDGLPDGVVAGTETIVRPATRQRPKQHLVVLTRTLPQAGSGFPATQEMIGEGDTITGFCFDGVAEDGTAPNTVNAAGSALIAIDGVADFVIRGNYIAHAGTFGISTRLSSGRIEENLVVENQGVGLNLTAGSDKYPARIEVLGNRVRDNVNGGMGLLGAAQTENDNPNLFAAHPFRRVPLPQFFDPALHPEEVPDVLDALVVGNEVSGSAFGIRCNGYLRDQYRLSPQDPAPETANLTAAFIRNVSRSNATFGVVVDAGQIPTANARKHVVMLETSWDETILEENGQGTAIYSFWRYASAISDSAASDKTFKFAHDSLIRVCGDITRFNYENRDTDPADGTPTNDTLIVNGVELTGTCVPLDDCEMELSALAPDLGCPCRGRR